MAKTAAEVVKTAVEPELTDAMPFVFLVNKPRKLSAKLRKLGNLRDLADRRVSDVIRSRGGGGQQVNFIGHLYNRTLGEVAELASKGDAEAEMVIKIVKQAGKQGKGGK